MTGSTPSPEDGDRRAAVRGDDSPPGADRPRARDSRAPGAGESAGSEARAGREGPRRAPAAAASALDRAQRRARDGRDGALLLHGAAATGKTEAMAHRLATLADEEGDPGRVLALTVSDGAAQGLAERADGLLGGAAEELWVGTWQTLGARLLREEATAAGLDPFFEVLGPAERLAILSENLDDLPLRLHQIRGNPISLLARLLRRIDSLKAAAVSAGELAERARSAAEAASGAATAAEREEARRELEFAELFAEHDRILAARGGLDRGEILLELDRLLRESPDASERTGARFPHLILEEVESLDEAHWAVIDRLRQGRASVAATLDTGEETGTGSGARFRSLWPGSEPVEAATVYRAASQVCFRRCANERAEAESVAREVEDRIAAGAEPERIGIFVRHPARDGSAVGAALEERSIHFRLADPAALFRRPEVRDTLAWLRVLADPDDTAAAARVITRPPIQLRSADLARLTTIARRRKLNLVDASSAALESPQFQPEARERITEFLSLHRAASSAMEERRADVFVRRLIERVGLRRQRMFAAQPEVAERLISLSRISELAAAWCRREPRSSTRAFVRYLSAIAEADGELAPGMEVPSPGSVTIMALDRIKGLEFDHVFVIGQTASSAGGDPSLATALSRARETVSLSWPESAGKVSCRPSPAYTEALARHGSEEEHREEELFGPGEGIHATYRMIREDVLEASWLTGRELHEPRLDITVDLNRSLARYLELLKLAALAQRPEGRPVGEAIETINGILRQVASPEQLAELDASALDEYLLDEEREQDRRRKLVAARKEPSLEAFLPRRGDGLRLSATDLDLYLTCPLKYKFSRVFSLPSAPTINQRFGILIHGVLDRFHRDHDSAELADPASLERLNELFEAGWRRTGFGDSDDELQFRDRARSALQRYWERERESEGEPVWLEKPFELPVGPHYLRGRVDRVDRLPNGEHELIDYKTGARKSREDLVDDLQLSLYRLAANRAWGVESSSGSYYYVLDAEKVRVEPQPDDEERVECTVMEVGEGVMSQDFEPRPSPAVCSWCDFRLVCPAAE